MPTKTSGEVSRWFFLQTREMVLLITSTHIFTSSFPLNKVEIPICAAFKLTRDSFAIDVLQGATS